MSKYVVELWEMLIDKPMSDEQQVELLQFGTDNNPTKKNMSVVLCKYNVSEYLPKMKFLLYYTHQPIIFALQKK